MSARRPLGSAAALIVALIAMAIFSAGAHAAPGDLDPTFSGDGKQTTGFAIGSSRASAAAVQPDGKIVAVGVDQTHRPKDFALARYNPDGSLDTSFSNDGKQRTDFEGFGEASGVAVQTNGKIVVVGGICTTSTDPREVPCDFALARYNPNGSLDTSFSGDGKLKTDLMQNDQALDVALQADGKIVAVGLAGSSGGDTDWALIRYNPNGSLDASFSGDGKQTTNFGDGDVANAVALQGDGKIVAVGYGGFSGGRLARYNPNGSLDQSFSGDGKQTSDLFGAGVSIQGDGRIVVGGGAAGDFALARYTPNGSLDPTFSGDGEQRTDFGGPATANGVALQDDGKIVLVGFAVGSASAQDSDFALARYNPNGSLDSAFSGDGKQTTDFGGYSDGAADVAIQGDGKIVAVGCGCAGGTDFALARYTPSGFLDPSFSGDGKRRTNFGGVDGAAGVAIQDDGKIVAVGDGFDQFALARYNPNGSLDPSFSGNGRQMTSFGGCCEGARAVALQSDGKIVAVGTTNDNGVPAGDFAVARYNPNGSLDTTFSGDGKQLTDFGGAFGDRADAVALQSDGKIVVAGIVDDFRPSDFALARYNPNGSLDGTFSGDGMQRTDFGFGGTEGATGLAVQGDGKIVAVGVAGESPMGDDFALARYDPNGSLDPSFSADGKETTDFGLGVEDRANGVAVQGDGKIVVVGVAGGGATANDFALARYDSNGSLDPTFSGDGRRRTDFRFGDSDEAKGVALQSDGNIVAVGVGRAPNQTDSFALARYLGN